MRESEIENATSFLRHPNVRESSDVSAKRGFLEGKGLTKEEIDEAFRRVGESGGSTATNAAATFDGNRGGVMMVTKPSSSSSSSSYGFFGSLARLAAVSGAAYLAYPSARSALERAADRLADRASANKKKTTDNGRDVKVIPDATVTLVSPGESIAATPESFAVARAAERAAERAERATEEAKSLREEIKLEVSTTLRESISDVKKLLEAELKAEMRELKETLHTELAARDATSPKSYLSREAESSKLREWPLATSPQGSESGESLVYSPPKPSRQHPAASDEFTLNNAVRETSQVSQVSVGDSPRMNGKQTLDDPPHPSNFMDILQMIENGQTPPGIKDIDDAPPNPNASIPRSSGSRPGKPWEAKRGGDEDEGEVTQVPIVKRVAGERGSPSSPWTPPPAPSLSSMMSISKTSPRRSVDQKVEGNANVNGRLEI